MKSLNINEVVDYCRKNECYAYAFYSPKNEIFIFEPGDGKDYDDVFFYSQDSGEETCAGGVEDYITLEELLTEEDFAGYSKSLEFFPFKTEDCFWGGYNNHYIIESCQKAIEEYSESMK